MTAEHRILQTLGKHFERRIPNTMPELGTVIAVDPIVIQLDYEKDIQLRYADGDVVINDQLILAVGDRLVLEEVMGEHNYVVLCRISGTVGVSKTGDGSRAVARQNDLITATLSGSSGSESVGDHGTHSHTVTVNFISGSITGGSLKVKVE